MERITNDTMITSCGAVVYRLLGKKIEILLVRHTRGNGAWGIPKGHIEPGESIEECVRREVREETGCGILELEDRLEDVYSHPMGAPPKKLIAYIAMVNPDSVVAPIMIDEIADARFFDTTALPPLHRYQTNLIKDVASTLKTRYWNDDRSDC